jgi:ketosteroid isomerase-like protein
MTFREALDKHVSAIQRRDLQALAETLPQEDLVLIRSDGRLVRSVSEFVDLHRVWFASRSWTLGARLECVHETPDMGVAVLHLDYRDAPAGGQPLHETRYLSLVFRKLPDGRWVLVQDQSTPIKRPAG